MSIKCDAEKSSLASPRLSGKAEAGLPVSPRALGVSHAGEAAEHLLHKRFTWTVVDIWTGIQQLANNSPRRVTQCVVTEGSKVLVTEIHFF